MYMGFFVLMMRRPPRSTRPATRFPYTTLVRAAPGRADRNRRQRSLCRDVPPAFRRGDRHNGDAQHRFSRELLGAGTRSPHMRIASIVTALAAGIAAASAVAAPGQSQRKIGVETKIRSDEHTSELQSLMRIPYAVSCLP